mmetsp:Transcript_18997/g.54472  ORF Transcript_18997/g.54472 Transcript_18997/m.54472 type:complete len:346 (+) Transcript_18997:439-1476(+)
MPLANDDGSHQGHHPNNGVGEHHVSRAQPRLVPQQQALARDGDVFHSHLHCRSGGEDGHFRSRGILLRDRETLEHVGLHCHRPLNHGRPYQPLPVDPGPDIGRRGPPAALAARLAHLPRLSLGEVAAYQVPQELHEHAHRIHARASCSLWRHRALLRRLVRFGFGLPNHVGAGGWTGLDRPVWLGRRVLGGRQQNRVLRQVCALYVRRRILRDCVGLYVHNLPVHARRLPIEGWRVPRDRLRGGLWLVLPSALRRRDDLLRLRPVQHRHCNLRRLDDLRPEAQRHHEEVRASVRGPLCEGQALGVDPPGDCDHGRTKRQEPSCIESRDHFIRHCQREVCERRRRP